MEFLVALAPIGLILLLCGGMHFFMMRGMHGGHETEAGHQGHSGLGSEDSPDRVARLESQVARLQREVEASQSNGQATRNGYSQEPVAAVHGHDESRRATVPEGGTTEMSFLRMILGGEPAFVDPVCEMKLPAGHARDWADHDGVTYHFCSTTCKERFEREPGRYLVGEKTGSREGS